MSQLIYDLTGVRGRSMKVYDNKVEISTEASLGTWVSGNASDGTKTIFYFDCIGVQFKKAATLLGYIQLETASGMMHNSKDNSNENSFIFDEVAQSNKVMTEVAAYITQQVEYIKAARVAAATAASSPADEIAKLKALLDQGALTQAEFDGEKQRLLAHGVAAGFDAPIEKKYDLAANAKVWADKDRDFIESIPGFSKEQLLQRKEELLYKLEVVTDPAGVEDIRSRVATLNNLIAQAVHLERGEITQEEFDAQKDRILGL